MLSRLRPLLVVVVTTFAVALGLPSVADAAAAKPKLGQCHRLTTAQANAMSDSRRAVPCSARHNLQTIAVLSWPTSLAGLTDEQLSAAGDACVRPFVKALGPVGRQSLTNYELYSFAPTAAQRAAGARWIRCDITLLRSHRPSALPRHRLTRPVVPTHVSDSIRTCRTRSDVTTTCDRRHAYRAVKAVVIRQSAYPSEAQFHRTATKRCPSGWDLAVIATPKAWAHGRHTIVCFDRTRK